MLDFLFFLLILFKCGVFPMSWDDCRSRPSPPSVAVVDARPVEHLEAP